MFHSDYPITYGYLPEIEQATDDLDPSYVRPVYGDLPKVEQSLDDPDESILERLRAKAVTWTQTQERDDRALRAQRIIEREQSDLERAELERVEAIVMGSPFDLMAEHFLDLPKSERRIFEYIVEHPRSVADDITLKETRMALGVRTQRLDRFARKVGYKNFQQLRAGLFAYVPTIGSDEDLMPHSLTTLLTEVNRFDCNTNRKHPLTAAERIMRAARIYCIGQGICDGSARQMECLLDRKHYDARHSTVESLISRYYDLSINDLVILYYNPLAPNTETLRTIFAHPDTRCHVIIVSTVIPSAFVPYIDNYLYVSAYHHMDFILNAPIVYSCLNMALDSAIHTRPRLDQS